MLSALMTRIPETYSTMTVHARKRAAAARGMTSPITLKHAPHERHGGSERDERREREGRVQACYQKRTPRPVLRTRTPDAVGQKLRRSTSSSTA